MHDTLKPQREPLPSWVEVQAYARLHLGFFDLHGGLGRRFGSLGVALDDEGLSTRVLARRADVVSASGPCAERAAGFAQLALEHLRCALDDHADGIAGCHADGHAHDKPGRADAGAGGLPHGVAIEVCHALPEHAGLGSGTQLALAVGSAVARLQGLRWPVQDMAAVLDRGRRSGIGLGTFEQGGFVVDGGHADADSRPPSVVARLPFPQDWRWVLVFDDRHQGLSGPAERQAFARLPSFPEDQAAQLCRLVLMQLLPALAEGDILRFGQAVTALQDRVGDHFAPAQGGRYASARVARALQVFRDLGAAAVGQTSWGPTGFALAADLSRARDLVDAASSRVEPGLRFLIGAARNCGADIIAHRTQANQATRPERADSARSSHSGNSIPAAHPSQATRAVVQATAHAPATPRIPARV